MVTALWESNGNPRCGVTVCLPGTDLSKSNVEKSNRFAKKSNLPPYYHVLHPRTRGWCVDLPHFTASKQMHSTHPHSNSCFPRYLFYDSLKQGLDAVYDITLGYVEHTPGERTTRSFLFNGRAPRQIHVMVKRHATSQLQVGPAKLFFVFVFGFDLFLFLFLF